MLSTEVRGHGPKFVDYIAEQMGTCCTVFAVGKFPQIDMVAPSEVIFSMIVNIGGTSLLQESSLITTESPMDVSTEKDWIAVSFVKSSYSFLETTKKFIVTTSVSYDMVTKLFTTYSTENTHYIKYQISNLFIN